MAPPTPITPLSNHPLPSQSTLASQYIGRSISSDEGIPTPAVILDRAVLQRNCDAMLLACEALGVGFRAHVKSHKTLELSKMQAGTKGPANMIVSTVIEAENLVPWVAECQAQGREASLLYGVPVPLSTIPRLVAMAGNLKHPCSINVIVDNLDGFLKFHERLVACKSSSVQIGVFIKVDTGYHRAGIPISSPQFNRLVQAVLSKAEDGTVKLVGFYSHSGQSYAGNSEEDAAAGLIEELVRVEEAVQAVSSSQQQQQQQLGKLVLTVGATPTVTATQNLLLMGSSSKGKELRDILSRLQIAHHVELHAGVYPLLDCQQIATHARSREGTGQKTFQALSEDNIAVRTLVEVNSVYDERAKPEALIAAGTLALGREPCKSYPGWGIVTRSLGNSKTLSVYDEDGDRTGWIIGKISQEHGILTWEGEREQCNPLTVGDRLLIWPNHACVAGAGFGWYLVVDSEQGGDTIVDVWVRWRGW